MELLLRSRKEMLSYLTFMMLYILVVTEFLSIIHNASSVAAVIAPAAIVCVAVTIAPLWSLWLFVAAIPLINGLSLTVGVGDVSFLFSLIYLAWLPGKAIARADLRSKSPASHLVNFLAALVLLNIFIVVAVTSESFRPSVVWLNWFSSFPAAQQSDNLWQIKNALILLKGIFLFRMVEIEIHNRTRWIFFARTVYPQMFFVVFFSLYHFVKMKNEGVNYIRLSLPFEDIHAYGSFSLLLFVLFLYFFVSRLESLHVDGKKNSIPQGGCNFSARVEKIRTWMSGWSAGLFIYGVLTIIMFLVTFYSFSRMTWLALVVISFVLFMTKLRSRNVMFLFAALLCLGTVSVGIIVPKIIQSGNVSYNLHRFQSFINFENIFEDNNVRLRVEFWERSVNIFKEYPFTGMGIGNFYRTNQFYGNRSLGGLDFENAHNYYLQLLAELGGAGLFLFLSVLVTLYFGRSPLSCSNGKQLGAGGDARPYRWGLAAYLLTMLTGHPLLLSSQQFLFWNIAAIVSSHRVACDYAPIGNVPGKRLVRLVGTTAVAFYLLGATCSALVRLPWNMSSGAGLYSAENWDGEQMQWMAQKAKYYLPLNSDELKMKVVAQPFNSQPPEGLTLTVAVNGKHVDTIRFVDGGERKLVYDVVSVAEQPIQINLEVDRVFRPRDIGLSRDQRVLGVAIGFKNYADYR